MLDLQRDNNVKHTLQMMRMDASTCCSSRGSNNDKSNAQSDTNRSKSNIVSKILSRCAHNAKTVVISVAQLILEPNVFKLVIRGFQLSYDSKQ